jgi:EpsI family protein
MVILICLGGYLNLYSPTPVPLKMDLKELPSTIGDWRWVRKEHPNNPFGILGADMELMNYYKNSSGREIRLYIGYFESQRGDKKVTHYRSKWLHKEAEVVEFAMNPHGTVQINKTIFKDRINNQLLLFWYDMNGKIIISRYRARIFTALDGLFRGRTNGAIVIVSKAFEHTDNPKDTLEDEVGFVQELLPLLRNYLPSS